MRVGLTYNLRGEQPSAEPALPDCDAEFDTAENIDLLAAAIASLGYDVCRIGNVQDLVRFVAAGQTVDIVFNMAEGQRTRSREAQVPAILEAFGIPYTGSDPLTVALCLDKAMTKRIWQSAGLPTPAFRVVSHLAELDQARLDQSPGRWLDLPLFVKPVHEGASKGIGTESIVRSEPELRERVDWTLTRYRQPALVEEYLPGREFTVGVLGNGRAARVLGIGEIALSVLDGVYGFAQKEGWEARVPRKLVPLEPGTLEQELSELALQAYHAVDCRDLGRLEIRLDRDGRPKLLEINPIVGLHPTHASLPILGLQAGLSYENLIGEILEHAINRWCLSGGIT